MFTMIDICRCIVVDRRGEKMYQLVIMCLSRLWKFRWQRHGTFESRVSQDLWLGPLLRPVDQTSCDDMHLLMLDLLPICPFLLGPRYFASEQDLTTNCDPTNLPRCVPIHGDREAQGCRDRGIVVL